MRFNCGPTWEDFRAARELWHPWFAWYPVRIGQHCYWLETVQRRGAFSANFGEDLWTWEYRDSGPLGGAVNGTPAND